MNFIKHLFPSLTTSLSSKLYPSLFIYKKIDYLELGRWNIEKDFKKTQIKIDLANNDNCGPCGHIDLKEIIHKK